MSDDMFKDAGPEKNAGSPGVPLVFGAPAGPDTPPPGARKPKKTKADKSEQPERAGKGLAASIAGFAAKVAIAFVGLSILWVLAYRVLPIPGTILMIERGMQGQDVRRSPKPLSRISVHLVRAVIASEDSRFCKHDGFDFDAINLAFEHNEAGKKMRGGSTISQQTAKNVFLWPGRTIIRKGFEAYYTLLIETFWPKGRIMEAYLNSIEFGNGYFGAEAAARGYFGKSAKDLTPRQAAALAAVLPSPNKWKVVNSGPYVSRRISTIQKRMAIVRRDGLADCVIAK